MNKYLLEVEAIQFTGDNADEIVENLCDGLELTEENLDAMLEDEELFFSDGNGYYELGKGDYIIIVPKKEELGGYLLEIMGKDEFEERARRLY